MLSLVQTIDQALGYHPPPLPTSLDPSSSNPHSHSHSHASDLRPPVHVTQSKGLKTASIQEKWVDYREEYGEFERGRWRDEGEDLRRDANEKSRREAGVENLPGLREDEDEDEDEEGDDMGMQ